MNELHAADVVPLSPRRVDTAVRIEALDGGPYLIAHDITTADMMVTTRTPRWPGQLLRVRFRLPQDSRAIRATCRVTDLVEVPRGVGLVLQFVGLGDEARAMLAAFVRRQAA